MIECKAPASGAKNDDQMYAYQYMLEQLTQATPESAAARRAGKQARHAAAYGIGDVRQAMNRLRRPYDPVPYQVDHLNPEQARWARAFHAVLGVGANFYAEAPHSRRAWLEAHYTEMATHDTPKGRKAAKVVAHRVMSALADEEPNVRWPGSLGEMKYQGSVTGRFTGNSADRIIVDELSSFHNIPRKKP